MSVEIYEVRVFSEGSESWSQNGVLHRLDGPAFKEGNGTKYWYQKGKLHRLGGPAAEYADGTKYWWEEGKLHRLDGPAIEWINGDKEWWINGVQIPEPKSGLVPITCDGKVVEIDGRKYKLQLQET